MNAITPFVAAPTAHRLRIFLIVPAIDGTDGEDARVAFQSAEAPAEIIDLTVLGFQRPGRTPLGPQLPGSRVVSGPGPEWAARQGRPNVMPQPACPLFARHLRKWMARAELPGDDRSDTAVQMMQQAPCCATPLRHSSTSFALVPIQGALDTPEALRPETGTMPLFTLRCARDRCWLRHDAALRAGSSRATMVPDVATDARGILAAVPPARFQTMPERDVDDLAPEMMRPSVPGQLKLVHVGRAARTGGQRDAGCALALLRDRPGITPTSADNGKEVTLCMAMAGQPGCQGRCRFPHHAPRDEVDARPAGRGVCTFPSCCEAAGEVPDDAMWWGPAVASVARGGADSIIDDCCGLCLMCGRRLMLGCSTCVLVPAVAVAVAVAATGFLSGTRVEQGASALPCSRFGHAGPSADRSPTERADDPSRAGLRQSTLHEPFLTIHAGLTPVRLPVPRRGQRSGQGVEPLRLGSVHPVTRGGIP